MGVAIGAFAVRRAVYIHASPLQIWHEFADVRRMSAWFGVGHTLEAYDPGKGGHVELSVDLPSGVQGFGGNIICWEDARELSFENNWFGDDAWEVPTIITIRLTPSYNGTLVELIHHGFERLGRKGGDEYLSYESGWDTRHLSALKKIVE